MFCYTEIVHPKNNKSISLTFNLCVFMVLFALASQAMATINNIGTSVWDLALTSMQLNDIDINEISLQNSWKHISDQFLLRSVLVVSDNSATNTTFIYKSAHCTGAELLNALAASYKDYTWTQDSNAGVIWFHPKDLAFDNILSSKIRIESDHLGVPMQRGILEAIEDVPNGIRVKKWGTGFTNTFNYPVDLQAGEYSVRDILNICCIANPNKTFFISVYSKREPQFIVISAVNLLSNKNKLIAPPPGILLYWTLEIGKLTEPMPSNEQIAAELANSDPNIRRAACKYAEAMLTSPWDFPFEKWMNISQSQEQALWVCLGATNIFVRSEETTYIDGIKKMQSVSKDFYGKGDPNLAVLVALQLARLANDTNALEIVSKRKFNLGDLDQIKSEINYSARLSSNVRNALKATGTSWLSTPEPSLKDLDKVTLKAKFIKSN